MLHKELIFILGFCSLSTIYTQDTTTTTPPENITDASTDTEAYYLLPIYSLHYNISRNNVSQLIFDLLIQDQFNNEVSTEDILNLLDSRGLIVSKKLIDLDIENLLKIGNINITDVLHDITFHVPVKKTDNMRKILGGFNIDFYEYQEYFIEVDDTNMYNLMKSGNYTEESIQNALTVFQKSEAEMISIIKTILLKDLKNVPVWVILSQYDEQLEALFYKDGITSNDIADYQTLEKMLENFEDLLNEVVYWATAISSNSLITVLNATFEMQRYTIHIDQYLRNVQNKAVYTIDNIDLNHTLSIITTPDKLESFMNIKYNTENSTNCYYFFDFYGVAPYKPENVTFKKNAIFTENIGPVQRLGSPLICDNQLSGMLVKQDETRLTFLTFSRDEADTPLEIPDWDDNEVEDADGGSVNYRCIYAILVVGVVVSMMNLL